VTETRPVPLRWRSADDDGGQPMLFAEDEIVERHVGVGEYRGLEFLHVNARRVINEVPAASRMPFRYTINAYRGCSHACAYCFARPTHEYLGLGVGADFERKLVVKVNAVERVRAELRSPRWRGDHIAMGTNTDPYQRAEGRYHLTQGIVAALGEARNPFSILTKSTLVLRDLDLLVAAAGRTEVRCNLSIGTLDEEVWKATEPGTPHPRRRVEAVKRLNDAGIPTGVLVAPVIPGWSDSPEQLEEVAAACLDAGAVSVTPIALHLRRGVKEHFLAFLAQRRPDLHAELARRYARSAYLPGPAQKAIEDRVNVVVGPTRRRRTVADTFGHPAPAGRAGPGSPPGAAGAPDPQLPLPPFTSR
jgi:DNA repair photolyase